MSHASGWTNTTYILVTSTLAIYNYSYVDNYVRNSTNYSNITKPYFMVVVINILFETWLAFRNAF